ncbi:MAG: hypothetical protein ABUL71_01330, partial [Gemmatimonadota bacterium]
MDLTVAPSGLQREEKQMAASPDSVPPHLTPAGRTEAMIPSLLALLAAICLVEAGTLLINAWPFAAGEVYWRFQTATQLLTAGPRFALLLTVISVAGVLAGK